MRVHHIAIAVADLAGAERFYAGVLGIPLRERKLDDRGEVRSVWLDLDGVILMLERTSGAPPRDPRSPGLHCLAITIEREERRRWIEHLQARRIPIERESEHSVYLRDPEGTLIALSHFPDR